MTGPADIKITGIRDTFTAESVVIEHGLVHAEGCWATRWGARNANIRYGQRCARSWPVHSIEEIRWAEARAAA